MALYHFHVGHIGRSKGYSAIAAAAYRAGQRLHDDYYGETQDYTHKGGVVASGIMLPPHAPDRYLDRETLWNELEKYERHPKAQLAYSFDIALQNEFTRDENIAIVKEFIRDNFVERGMLCDWAVHEPDRTGGIQNPHFHVLVPIRPLKPDGEWDAKQRREYRLDNDGGRMKDKNGKYLFNAVPTTDWGSPETLETWRRKWTELVNRKFEEKGLAVRIDDRSYKERGLANIPQVHEGSAVRRMEQKGIITDKGSWNRWVRRANMRLRELISAISELREWVAWAKDALSQMKELSQPTIASQLITYYTHRDQVANTYKQGSQKAKKGNLQSHINVQAYVQEKNISTIEDVDRQAALVESSLKSIEESVKPMNERLAKLKAYMGYFRDYKKYLPVYEESQGIFFKGRKKAYQDEHRRELNLLHMAKRKLEKIDALSDLKTMEAMCRKDLERTEQKIADRLSQLGKERLEDEVRYLKIIRKAVDYCSNMGGMVSGEGTGADEMTLTERGKQDNKEVHKRSFSDALADKAAEADRINAGRTYGRNNPIHGRDER